MSHAPIPENIVLHQQSKVLELTYPSQQTYRLPFEFLRVWSPSAEVRGHGPEQETIQTGKHDVLIQELELVGHYAVRPVYSDGHDSGLYTWEYLYDLCVHQEEKWQEYLDKLKQSGLDRFAPMTQSKSHACGH